MAEGWIDSIGREWPNARGFVAVCHCCGAVMHTQNLLGRLEFNEQGWGVWSERHPPECPLKHAGDADWHRVENQVVYHALVKLSKRVEPTLVIQFLEKKVSFADLRAAVA